MAKFSKTFIACINGAVHPTEYKIGDNIPDELLDVAKSLGIIQNTKSAPSNKSFKSAPENKGIKHD